MTAPFPWTNFLDRHVAAKADVVVPKADAVKVDVVVQPADAVVPKAGVVVPVAARRSSNACWPWTRTKTVRSRKTSFRRNVNGSLNLPIRMVMEQLTKRNSRRWLSDLVLVVVKVVKVAAVDVVAVVKAAKADGRSVPNAQTLPDLSQPH
jgi:hypothetical protein